MTKSSPIIKASESAQDMEKRDIVIDVASTPSPTLNEEKSAAMSKLI